MPACPFCSADNSEFNVACRICGQPLLSSAFLDQAAPQGLPAAAVPVSAPQTLAVLGLPDHFTEVREVGRGGMGVVYKVHDGRLMRDIALKCLTLPMARERDASRMLREARSLSKAQHRNLVTVYEVYPLADRLAIAMEWVEGHTLAEQMPLPQSKELLDYMLGLALGLEAVHAQGMSHGDIKASNVMIDGQGTIKLLDFGLARQLHGDGSAGTGLAAMSPDLLPDWRPSQADDVFCLGLLLYEMATGVKPYARATVPETLAALAGDTPPEPSKLNPRLPKGLSKLIRACLRQNPEQRPAMPALTAELKALRAHQARQESKLRYLVGGLALVVLALGLALWLKPAAHPKPPLRSVALLPLTNLTGDASLNVALDGALAELSGLLNAQAPAHRAWVLPASHIYGKDPPSPESLADNFGIDTVLSGTIRYHGDQYRINLTRLNLKDRQAIEERTIDLSDRALLGRPDALLRTLEALLGWPHDDTLAAQAPADGAFWGRYLEAQGYLYRHDRPGNLERAIAGFKAALAARPEFLNAHLALAQAYRKDWEVNEHAEALTAATEQIEQALALRGDLSVVHVTHGDLLASQGAYDQARQSFLRAKEVDPQNPAALYGLGRTYRQLHDVAAALAAYEEATRLAPYDWVGQTEYGRFLFGQGHFKEAVPIFQNLVRLASENAFAQGNLGVCLFYSGNPREGLAAVNRAIAIKPSAFLYSTQGAICYFLKDYTTASRSFKQAIALKDGEYLYYGNLGDALRQAGDLAGALAAYERAIDLVGVELAGNNEQIDARLLLILYLAKTHQAERAHQEMNRLPAKGGPIATYTQAIAHAVLGDADNAFALLKQAVAAGYPIFEIEAEPEWDAFRADPRYQAVVQSTQKSGQGT